MDEGSRTAVIHVGPTLWSELGSEIASSFAVIGAFVALALGSAALLRWVGAGESEAPYPAEAVTQSTDLPEPAPTLWLVDGFNLLHATLLHGESRASWWRSESRDRVVELASRFESPGAEVVVVFDGRDAIAAETVGGRPRVVFAPTADDWLLAAVREAPDPTRVAVVTADRRLAARARHRGAQVLSPSAFAARCRRPAETPAS